MYIYGDIYIERERVREREILSISLYVYIIYIYIYPGKLYHISKLAMPMFDFFYVDECLVPTRNTICWPHTGQQMVLLHGHEASINIGEIKHWHC